MNAVIVKTPGGPGALEVVTVPEPIPGPGQVRLRVRAAAVNPVDAATRSGALGEHGLVAPQPVLGVGWDVAGTVEEAGPGVDGLVPGDAVIGLRDELARDLGTYAEQVVLDAGAVGIAPRTASFAAAATLPLNGLTALQTLDRLALAPGQTLLVTGAAGAVGGFLVELGALRGLRVVAVAGRADEELVRGLGAAVFVERTEPLGAAVRAAVPGGVDAAADAAVLGVAALDAVRGGGAYASLVAGAEPFPLRGIRVERVFVRADGQQLTQLSALADAGHLTLRVAHERPLDEAAAAHEQLARGGLRGRIVLIPAPAR